MRYPRAATPALSQLSLRVEPGETVLLLGPSGSGKSTLALTLAGQIPQGVYADVEGQVRIGELDPLHDPVARTASQVGLLFQDPEAGFATLTVEDELAFGLENLGVPAERMPDRIAAALDQGGASQLRQRRLNLLSGGEAQRVALAALLAMGPPVLVLDEPTSNLDPAAAREFFEVLADILRNRTVVLIEHNLDGCLHLADRLVLLDRQGELLAQGEPEAVFERHLERILQAGIWVPRALDPEQQQPAPEPAMGPATEHLPAAEPAALRRPTAASRPPALQFQDLHFAYPGRPPLFDGLELEVPPGGFMALVGPNGSGKTTLAQLALSLLPPPPRGEIHLFGEPVQSLPLAELTRRAGYVFQNPEHQFVAHTAADELAVGLRARGWAESRIADRVAQLLERFELFEHAGQNPFTLSQGQKRRLSVACMLVTDQRLLILDEPTFGQDRLNTLALLRSLSDLNREGVTIVMITHDMRLVRRYARSVAVLLEGRVAFHGSPEALFQRPDLLDVARLR